MLQKQPREVLYKKTVLKHFARFTGKHLCQSLFLITLQGFNPVTLLKSDFDTVFSGEYCETFKNTYFEKHLRTAASDVYNLIMNTELTSENIFTCHL